MPALSRQNIDGCAGFCKGLEMGVALGQCLRVGVLSGSGENRGDSNGRELWRGRGALLS